MVDQINRPSQPKQSSRKGKKAWRKNIDISSIEEGIESGRDLERVVGISSLDKLKESNLFTIDVEGDENIESKHLKGSKRLKADEILSRRSAIPALSGPKKSKNKVSKNEIRRLKQLAGKITGGTKKAITDKEGIGQEAGYDLWDIPTGISADNEKQEFIKDLTPAVSHQKSSNIPKTLLMAAIPVKKGVQPVNLPHEGRSYNPSIEAWKQLIREEHEKEEEREKQRIAILERKRRIEEVMKEVDGTELQEGEDVEDDDDRQSTSLSANEPVEIKRKTTAMRNKESRDKEKMQLQEELKSLKRQLNDLENLPKLLAAEEEKIKKQENIHKKTRIDGKKLGSKYKVLTGTLDVKLSDELTDCLRRLKPEGNLAKDRYRNLQERGIIEARVQVKPRRKYKRKVVEKYQFKSIR